MLHFNLKLTSHTVSIIQHLKQSDITSRLHFESWIQDHPNIVEKILFSAEVQFYLNAVLNKRNYRIWEQKNPMFTLRRQCMERTYNRLGCSKCVKSLLIGPYFFGGYGRGCQQCRYLNLLCRKFEAGLAKKDIDINDVWF